uniref:Vacuolar protein sorting-associated protein 26C n=1 Tax=Arcella intermedia TaxID=1963864 RepID=A0A6B2LCZ5_9EUKA
MEIVLKRIDRIYKPGDKVSGNLVIQSKGSFAHSGITIQMTGVVTLQLSAKSVGLFEAFYNSLKPIQLVDYTTTIEKSGNIKDGQTEIPFEFDLKGLENQELYETYHGVYVNVSYSLKADLIRKYLGKNLTKTVEFIVELPSGGKFTPSPEEFAIAPENLDVSKKVKGLPEFDIVGKLDTNRCLMSEPFEGYLVLKSCAEPIKCIELQLVRVETCGCADGWAKEATEIQNIQIADGDIPSGLEIPIFMIFPRLFTCPTTQGRTFKIDFEVNIVLMFPDGRLVSKKFPVTLVR